MVTLHKTTVLRINFSELHRPKHAEEGEDWLATHVKRLYPNAYIETITTDWQKECVYVILLDTSGDEYKLCLTIT